MVSGLDNCSGEFNLKHAHNLVHSYKLQVNYTWLIHECQHLIALTYLCRQESFQHLSYSVRLSWELVLEHAPLWQNPSILCPISNYNMLPTLRIHSEFVSNTTDTSLSFNLKEQPQCKNILQDHQHSNFHCFESQSQYSNITALTVHGRDIFSSSLELSYPSV